MDLEKLPELLTIKQVSEILGVSTITLRRWDREGILKPFRPTFQNIRRYRKQDIIKFINKDSNPDITLSHLDKKINYTNVGSLKKSKTRRKEISTMQYKVELLTGIRPTGDLTVANYLGAVAPIVELQSQGMHPVVFVADLHALTDNEPEVVRKFAYEVVADYIALGIDPKKTQIFLQSDIIEEVTILTSLLARHVSVAELLRVPTLKDKIKKNARPETASAFLLLYPVMMAADILLQRAKMVAVGEDQVPHVEMTRLLARRFNKKYREVFPIPRVLEIKPLRILSLKGEGKMSKSNPEGAIFLTDNLEAVTRKIKSAETAFEGVMNEKLESLILVAKSLAKTDAERNEINDIIEQHKRGKRVMAQFKQSVTQIVSNFLQEFQARKTEITRDMTYIQSILEEGAKFAKENARETITVVQNVLYGD